MKMTAPQRKEGFSEKRKEREERRELREKTRKEKELSDWIPKTETGKLVKEGKIENYNQLLSRNLPVLEPEIIDFLIPNLQEKVIEIRKTTKVRRSGRQFSFRAAVLIGDGQEFIGLGIAKDKERWPAARKATNAAKLNLIKVRKGSGSWESTSNIKHSLPFKVEGKCASVIVKLLPAPRGIGLVAGENIKDVLRFAGLEDVWCNTFGATGTKLNFVLAAIDALSKTTKMKISEDIKTVIGEK